MESGRAGVSFPADASPSQASCHPSFCFQARRIAAYLSSPQLCRTRPTHRRKGRAPELSQVALRSYSAAAQPVSHHVLREDVCSLHRRPDNQHWHLQFTIVSAPLPVSPLCPSLSPILPLLDSFVSVPLNSSNVCVFPFVLRNGKRRFPQRFALQS